MMDVALSRGGRISPGTEARLGSARTSQQGMRQLVAEAAARRSRISVPFTAVLKCARVSVTGVFVAPDVAITAASREPPPEAFTDESARESHREGWEGSVGNLERALSR